MSVSAPTAPAEASLLERLQTALLTPATARQQRGLYLLISLLTLLLMLWHLRAFGVDSYPDDDAFIVAHNAQVLHWGHDPNYGNVPALAGATSPIHLALVALLAFVMSPLAALNTVMWLGALLYALGLARLAFGQKASLAQAALLVFLGVTLAWTPYQLMNGLETGLAMTAVVWLLALLSSPATTRRLGVPILCGLLPYVRPDLTPLSLLALALLAWERFRTASDRRQAMRDTLTDLALAGVCALPWALWCQFSLGVPYPTSVVAKRYFFAEALLPQARKWPIATGFLWLFLRDLGLLAPTLLLLPWTRIGRMGLLFMGIFLVFYETQAPSTLYFQVNRYLYPLVPLLFYGVASCLRHPDRRLRLAITLLLAVGLWQNNREVVSRWGGYVEDCQYYTTCNRNMCRWCGQYLPPNAVLLVHDAGAIAYETHLHLVDVVGLKTPSSIAIHRALTFPSQGALRGKAIQEIALRSHANYLLFLEHLENSMRIIAQLRQHGWTVTPIHQECNLSVFRLQPPAAPADVPTPR